MNGTGPILAALRTGPPDTGPPDRPADAPAVGRERELTAIERALDQLAAGVPRVIVFAGEPGIGKSWLLDRAAESARRRGVEVTAGRLLTPAQGPPLGALLDPVLHHVQGIPQDMLARLGRYHRERRGGDHRESAQPSTDPIREVMLAQWVADICTLLETMAATGPVMVTVDDVHNADQDTTRLLERIMLRPVRGPLLLLLAHRHLQTPSRLRGVFDRARDAIRFELDPLSAAQTEALTGGGVSRAWHALLHGESRGVPGYFHALLASARPSPPRTDRITLGTMPHQVEAAVAAELDALSPGARLIASAAAVIGEKIDPGLLSVIADLPGDAVFPAIGELVARDMVRLGPETGRFAFRHPVVGRAVYQVTDAGWRLSAHARAARVLAERRALAVDRAPHLVHCAAPGDSDAVAVLVEAAAAIRSDSADVAARWLRVALRLLPGDAGPQARGLVLLELGAALGAEGRIEDGRDVLHEALRLLPASAAERRAAATLCCADLERRLDRTAEAQALIRSALRAQPGTDSESDAVLAIGLAGMELLDGRTAPARVQAARDLPLPADLPPSLSAATHGVRAFACCRAGAIGEATAEAAQATALTDGLVDGELAPRLQALLWLGCSELLIDRPHDAVRHLDRAVRIALATGQQPDLIHLLIVRSAALSAIGRVGAAVASAEGALEVAQMAGGEMLVATARAQYEAVTTVAGVTGGSTGGSPGYLPASPSLDWFGALVSQGVAGAELIAGRPERSAALLAAAGGGELPAADPWSRVGWHELMTRVCLDAERVEEADGWATSAEAGARAMALPSRTGLALLARARVLVHQDVVAGPDAALAAAQALSSAGFLLDAARARCLAATALERHGRIDCAVRELDTAQQIFQECGADGLARHEAGRLADVKSTLIQPRHRRGADELATLTRREQQVATLVCEGLTNRQIAGQMFVTEKTVEMHLSRVFAKLKVTNRIGVARVLWRAH